MRLVVLLLLLGFPALAQAQSALLSSEVSEEVTGADATQARSEAMDKAKIEGFAALLDRLAPDQKKDILQKLDVKKILALVRGIEVVKDEKIIGNKYSASFRVNYDAVAINNLLGTHSKDAPEVASHSSSLLVIPVYSEGGGDMLWEKENAWRVVWQRMAVEEGGGAVLAPYGDAEDVGQINAQTAQSNPYTAFNTLLGRYGAAEVAVLKATYSADPAPHLTVLRRLIGPQRSDMEVLEYSADPQEDRDALLTRAAREIVVQLAQQRNAILEKRALNGQTAGRQLVVIPITTLTAWTQTRAKLLSMPVVTQVELHALAATQADAMIHYKGTPEALASALEAAHFRVHKADTYWVVSP